uniref:AlNc14C22G2284 protein n=1 Tax=Albugo laibachii Nc14 TaxID=890382 RepID=F0W5W9_9STRA|nr:AlNc14C22G2284 [Albugo laibachii Nc14]|eukprot:CCA16510.1 AlNc14C22G2284 [Albugo laibachii Nc14]
MSRKNNRDKMKAQHELDIRLEKERKELLKKKRERKAKKAQITKKVPSKVLRRMRLREKEKEEKEKAETSSGDKMDIEA